MELFSIGYATKPFDVFIQQLQQHAIGVIADVRSVPFSKVFFDYHQNKLEQSLPLHGIKYVYLGKELGPRSKSAEHYDDTGQVQFDRLQQSTLFLEGITRLRLGMSKNLRIALLCAEKDPATCHRSLLISHYLARHNAINVLHINHEGALESQAELEDRLISMQDVEVDLLTPKTELRQLAYERQLQQTSYRKQ